MGCLKETLPMNIKNSLFLIFTGIGYVVNSNGLVWLQHGTDLSKVRRTPPSMTEILCLSKIYCLLSTGTDDENEDHEIRRFAVISYINLLEKPILPDILIRVNSWVSC